MARIKMEATLQTFDSRQVANHRHIAAPLAKEAESRCPRPTMQRADAGNFHGNKRQRRSSAGHYDNTLFFNPLIGNIFADRTLMYHVLHLGVWYHYIIIRPVGFEDGGPEAILFFV
ncbi:unnamed protein product [Triticum turgidum subsp. durum]|uniref:Uncharacterized protein n=1 Tax=Triticum turgidum subsp. durum TaxID=4567 RepID=A0A9R1QWQ6_TRITD|nr:unnamed protein product [Triticum turgidum subsp. durum]